VGLSLLFWYQDVLSWSGDVLFCTGDSQGAGHRRGTLKTVSPGQWQIYGGDGDEQIVWVRLFSCESFAL
jgi:hypothetical protein